MKFTRFCLLALCACSLTACLTRNSDVLIDSKEEQLKTYAEAYAPARTALEQGTINELLIKMENTFVDEDGIKFPRDEIIEKLVSTNSELAIVEKGLLTLNGGNFERALVYFDAAEIKMEENEDKNIFSKFGSFVTKGAFSTVIGSEEMQDYHMRGYEKVMLLNYKALCYMLLGDRKAYNVTRKAIDKQQEEWEKFQELLAKYEAKREEHPEETAFVERANVDNRDAATKKKAELVPNAYVNPFGDYMDAILMEMDGIDDTSIRDNAILAYKKVLENNKDCTTAKTATKEVRKGVPRGKKLVHIILADGFSPERKEEQLLIDLGEINSFANFATATPIPSNVAGARVYFGGNKQTFASLSKMESIILRDDQDRLPFRYAMIGLALARSGVINTFFKALDNAIGIGEIDKMGESLASSMQRPDTRSWRTLPNQVVVARFYVPNSVKNVTIETFDVKKRRMAKTTVNIAAKGPTVVYAVSYDKRLNAYANKNSWIINK